MEKDGIPVDEANGKVTIELTAHEALVLFELLYRWDETDAIAALLEHPAERRVLWTLLGTLQRTLVEPFLPDYRDRLDQARELVQDGHE